MTRLYKLFDHISYKLCAYIDTQYEQWCVRKGARLLDKILPGWHKQITLEKLNMMDGDLCMMGQLFGDDVEAKLAWEMYPEEMSRSSLSMHDSGYFRAFQRNLVRNLMDKKHVRNLERNLGNLRYVCNGHDTKCLWAKEIATRLDKDNT